MFRKTITLLLTTLLAVAVQAQVDDPNMESSAESNIIAYHMRDFCPTYNVDARIVNNDENYHAIMDSLQKVQPNAYPLMSQWCRQQRARMNSMVRSMREDYTWDGDIIVMDSEHHIVDAGSFLVHMEQTANLLKERADNYDRLEQKRIEAERAAAEERARAEARRIQLEKNNRIAELKEGIKVLHNSITSTCDAHGVSDKARINELKNIYYAYLSVYNKYDIASDITSDDRINQLSELKDFQNELIDSVLGENSFRNRIDNFGNTLKLRAGKNHTDVTKSYNKVFKRVSVPITFKSIAEYHEYTAQLRDIIVVQESYLKVIELRETISRNTNGIQTKCSKKHRDIYSSYKEIVGELNTIPSYSTLNESQKFVATLQEFIQVQEEYSSVIDRIDVIETRSDSIQALCQKDLKDIGTAYKELVDATDFVPKFINISSADYYNKTLDEFEQIQQHYGTVIGLRKIIHKQEQEILSAKNAPKGLMNGYKQMLRNTHFTPNFNTAQGGADFAALLSHFIKIQDKFKDIIAQNTRIESTSKQFKTAFKEYGNIQKAYNRMISEYTIEAVILSESDLNSYRAHQDAVMAMQSTFEQLINSMEKEDYNQRLKKVKEIDKIKLIMGIK